MWSMRACRMSSLLCQNLHNETFTRPSLKNMYRRCTLGFIFLLCKTSCREAILTEWHMYQQRQINRSQLIKVSYIRMNKTWDPSYPLPISLISLDRWLVDLSLPWAHKNSRWFCQGWKIGQIMHASQVFVMRHELEYY